MLHLFFKHWKTILFYGFFAAAISFALCVFVSPKYSAESSVLIISRDRTGVDPYTQSKSAERIGENLAQVMRTSDFMKKTLESSVNFNKEKWLNLSDRKQRKQWQKDVQAQVAYGTSLLKIVAYGEKDDVFGLSTAVTETLATRGWEYVGGDIILKTVNPPIVSRWIARPNVALNTVLGFLAGILLSCAYVYKYKRSFFGI
jgi:capsular polysaccharide biosynthesis protein